MRQPASWKPPSCPTPNTSRTRCRLPARERVEGGAQETDRRCMAVADPACRAPTLPAWRHAPARARPVHRSGATSAGSAPAVGCGSDAEDDESRWGEGGGVEWGRDRSAAVPRAAHALHVGATLVGSAPLMGCRSGDGGGGETVWRRGPHWGRRRAGARGRVRVRAGVCVWGGDIRWG
jgi:hypothetical protein